MAFPRTTTAARSIMTATPGCRDCRLRQFGFYENLSDSELEFLQSFKIAHGRTWAGELLIEQGTDKAHLATLYSGWAAKTTTLPSGETYLVRILLPGDLIGLESVLYGPSRHSVMAVTDITYCTFDHRQIDAMMGMPQFARRLVTLLLAEKQRTYERLAVVGACNARRNFAHFVLDLFQRLRERQMARDNGFRVPLSSMQLADALGLTTVHLNRVLRGFRDDRILTLENHTLSIHDLGALREIAAMSNPPAKGSLLL
jgi:CRP-like cAMP-binding protein